MWSTMMQVGNHEVMITNYAHGFLGPHVPKITFTAHELESMTNEEIIAVVRSFQYFGDDIDLVSLAYESNFNPQFIGEVQLRKLIKSPVVSPEMKKQARAILRGESNDTEKQMGQPKQVKKRSGYVYLLSSELGCYKIGQTIDVNSRLSSFGITLPFEVELVHSVPADDRYKAESELHERYDDKCTNGEWFDLGETDVQEIKSLVEYRNGVFYNF